MREELLKMARDYLNSVTVEELKKDLIECGVDEIKPSPCPIYERNGIKNSDSDNHIEYSIEEPYYFNDSIEYLGGESWIIVQTAS